MLHETLARATSEMPLGLPRRPAVLVVEDEPLLLDLVVEALEADGFAVRFAANAAGALAILRSGGPIGLMFTDIDMPGGLDGYALACEARALCPDLKVVYTSGARRSLERERILPDSPFVQKPYRPSAISALIDAILAS